MIAVAGVSTAGIAVTTPCPWKPQGRRKVLYCGTANKLLRAEARAKYFRPRPLIVAVAPISTIAHYMCAMIRTMVTFAIAQTLKEGAREPNIAFISHVGISRAYAYVYAP